METAIKENNKKARRVEEASEKKCCLLIVTEVFFLLPPLCVFSFVLLCLSIKQNSNERINTWRSFLIHCVYHTTYIFTFFDLFGIHNQSTFAYFVLFTSIRSSIHFHLFIPFCAVIKRQKKAFYTQLWCFLCVCTHVPLCFWGCFVPFPCWLCSLVFIF